MKKIITTLITASVIFIGCIPEPVTPHPITPTSGSEYCQPAEEHLKDLCKQDPVSNSYCCKIVSPTKRGETYANFCDKKQVEGVNLNPKCISLVTSCGQIDKCTGSE